MNTNLPFDKAMVTRMILLFLVWLNQFLAVKGYSPLPFNNEDTEIIVSSVVTLAMSLWAAWKNNAITRNAREIERIAEQKGLK